MNGKIRVAAYCRVSTDKSDQMNSLANQQKYFTEYINNNPVWQLVEVYSDEGLSGTSTKKRRNFNRMIADAENHKIDLILTKEVSRFARNTVDTLEHTRKLKSIGVTVLFINDNINTSDNDGELRLTIMASMAQDESRKTSERVKWGQKRSMESGVVFGRDMLGYRVNGGKLFVNPVEAGVVRLIYHKFLNEGKGTHVIAKELQKAGINPKRGRKWSNTVILRVLRNEKYVGDLLQQKTFTPDYLSHSKKYNQGERENIYIKDHHEAIIDRATWDNTQKELVRRSPSQEIKSKYSNRYWCSGKLECGECGAKFVNRTKMLKNGNRYKAWRCYNAANHGTAKKDKQGNNIGCNSHCVNDRAIHFCVQYVLEHIRINKNKLIKELETNIKAIQSDTTIIDTSKFHKKIDEINDLKKGIIDLRLKNEITAEDLAMMKIKYATDIDDLLVQIKEAENANSIKGEQMRNIQMYISEINKMLDFKSNDELILKESLEKVVVYNDNILIIYFKCVPSCIKLHYTTKGKMENYQVCVDKIEVEGQ